MNCTATLIVTLILAPVVFAQEVVWTAEDGLTAGWYVPPVDDPGNTEFNDWSFPLSVWRISDGSADNIFMEPVVGYVQDVALDVLDSAVYEIVLQHQSGMWKVGLADAERDLSVTFFQSGAGGVANIGFYWPAGLDSAGSCWSGVVEVDSDPSQLHTIRVEKHVDDFVRVLFDGTEILTVPYEDMPLSYESCDGAPNFPVLSNTATLARGHIGLVDSNGSIWIHSYRHYIGGTSFPDEAPTNPRLQFALEILNRIAY